MHQNVTRYVGDNKRPNKDIVDGSKAYVETNSKKPTNIVMKEEVNAEIILDDFKKAWQTLDAELICKHLATEFRYDSQWVFESLDYQGHVDYIRGKFETLRRSNAELEVAIVEDSYLGGKMLAIKQNGNVCFYRIEIKDGKVVKGDLCAF